MKNIRTPFQRFLVPLLFSLALAVTPLRAAETNSYSYLPPGQPDAAVFLAPPPLPGSAEQAADMAAVVAAFHSASSNDFAFAFSEKKFSIFNFTPAIGTFFQPGKFPKTEAFFERVQKEAETITDAGKDFWKRPRPFMTDTNLAIGKLEKSFSYPSGHSTEGTVLALVLADLFPDKQDGIMEVSRNLGWHRVWIARHYPSDIHASRAYAQAIVREMKKSPKFQSDFAEVKIEIAIVKP
jgi:acid phosphatase (class A)